MLRIAELPTALCTTTVRRCLACRTSSGRQRLGTRALEQQLPELAREVEARQGAAAAAAEVAAAAWRRWRSAHGAYAQSCMLRVHMRAEQQLQRALAGVRAHARRSAAAADQLHAAETTKAAVLRDTEQRAAAARAAMARLYTGGHGLEGAAAARAADAEAADAASAEAELQEVRVSLAEARAAQADLEADSDVLARELAQVQLFQEHLHRTVLSSRKLPQLRDAARAAAARRDQVRLLPRNGRWSGLR
jgi:hypothetical protein